MSARLLVTGFGPFPTVPRNPSAAVARRVAADPRLRRLGIEAGCRILTTSYVTLPWELGAALAEEPDAVLLIGVASRSRRIRIETRATGRRSRLFPDAAGRTAPAGSSHGGLSVLRTSAPAVAALRTIAAGGLPCRLSRDAGRYLCNAAYHLALARPEPVPTLFIHIPHPPSRRPARRGDRRGLARLAWDERLVAALVEIGIAMLASGRRVAAPDGLG